MPGMSLTTLLFDFDGTLIDSLGPTLTAFQVGIEACGHGKMSFPEIRAHFGAHEMSIFERIVGSAKAPRAYEAYRAHLLQQREKIPLHPGVPSLLQEAQARGLRLGIVTGRGRDSTEALLDHHRLQGTFEAVVTDHDVPAPKPSPLGIQLALQKLGAPPAEACYAGDSWVDVRAALSAGVRAFGARWDPLADFARLAPEDQPHAWLTTPQEIWTHL
jgi:phosphoglycolate phosphatase/pyrophosphatase PpaX